MAHPQPFVRSQSLLQSRRCLTHHETGPEVSCIHPLARSPEMLEKNHSNPTIIKTTQHTITPHPPPPPFFMHSDPLNCAAPSIADGIHPTFKISPSFYRIPRNSMPAQKKPSHLHNPIYPNPKPVPEKNPHTQPRPHQSKPQTTTKRFAEAGTEQYLTETSTTYLPTSQPS